jgi:16S rRNA (guanine527-N7)-methyltransferase
VNAADLSPLRARYGLSGATIDALLALSQLLLEDPRAPTAVRDPVGIRDDHVADSLVALEVAEIRTAGTLIDIGAGAGLPGLVLAAALPDTRVVEVEATGRKCEFINRAAQTMTLANVSVRHARAEELLDLREQADVVVARALAPLAVLAEYAAPLLRVGGALVAWRGKSDLQAEVEARVAAEILGMSELVELQVKPYPDAVNRYLYLMSKVSVTPERFPRRPGVARKRPLGSS